MENLKIPSHLQKYIVKQEEVEYTQIDHAVWRYILKQLTSYLSKAAHPCYMEGLKKTGISLDRIPRIADIDRHLNEFGWHARPVSGFIPPAAFMELQSLGILPIASDMRTLEHLDYTPAPDIVHEAAGHAPILVNPEFSDYLKNYAQVAAKSILHSQDLAQYAAIRTLSDLKEHPGSTPQQIKKAETKLGEISKSIVDFSEAALLARMNWWTAEYGLIGPINDPKIYGAGLLSSVGESQSCLSPKVKKIPFSLDCIKYSYDITEPQPQLFVVEKFEDLKRVLQQFADTMAYRRGGMEGLEKILRAQTVNTVEYNSGCQVSGKLAKFKKDSQGRPFYLQFEGPSQLSLLGRELEGQGRKQHPLGFGSPVGLIKGNSNCLSTWENTQVKLPLVFESGVRVEGDLAGSIRKNGRLLVLSIKNCKVTWNDEVLFSPDWGIYDMAVGSHIASVFGGPADRESFGETEDFPAAKVPRKNLSPSQEKLNDFLAQVQRLRDLKKKGQLNSSEFDQLSERSKSEFPKDWLIQAELDSLIATRVGIP